MINILRLKVAAILIFGFFIIGFGSSSVLANPNNQNGIYDPLESMNRSIFNFNEMVYDNVFDPAARTYKRIMPDPLELIVGNFFSNLNDVVVITNSVLQLNYKSALATGARLLINTTFGIFGMIDIASDISAVSDINLSKRNEDFGQTLGRYGVGSGAYIVLPLLGPSSARDAFGLAVDSFFMDPISQGVTGVFLNNVSYINSPELRFPVAAGYAINKRAQFLDEDRTLEEAALDKYEFMRDAYLQRRVSLVNNNTEAKENSTDK
ncbi:MAG: VacJ family lipoprotein [Nitrosomonas sp.]|nr:MAG: VacJ family lipoprotein [Nitrosomonas sp.]